MVHTELSIKNKYNGVLLLPSTVKNFHGIYMPFMKVLMFCATALFLMACNFNKKGFLVKVLLKIKAFVL